MIEICGNEWFEKGCIREKKRVGGGMGEKRRVTLDLILARGVMMLVDVVMLSLLKPGFGDAGVLQTRSMHCCSSPPVCSRGQV